jgi:hypothetical protein
VKEFKVSVSSGEASKIMIVTIMEAANKTKKDTVIDLIIRLFLLIASLKIRFAFENCDSACRPNSSL